MDDRRAALADLLRSCVQCGLCLPHCATYLSSGNEVQSPRGRLQLLGSPWDQRPDAAPDSYLAAFDQCIGCRACETVCPSGVPFTILEYGQHLAANGQGRSDAVRPAPAVPGPVLRRLDSPGFLNALRIAGSVGRGVASAVGGSTWRRKMAAGPKPVAELSRLLSSMPQSPANDEDLEDDLDALVAASGRARGATVGSIDQPLISDELVFFTGCANAGLLPATSRRLLASLAAAGYKVRIPGGQECCGALAAHTGRPGRVARLRRRNESTLGGEYKRQPIIVEAAGCGQELKSYGPEISERITDAVEVLADSPQPTLRSVPLRVAFHDPCHARHGQGLIAAPRQLLSAIPDLQWQEAVDIEVCCGSGGAWGLRYPEMSLDLARRKAADLAAGGPDLIVTTNPGCLGQIADGLALEAPGLPILPLTDLWWYATQIPDQ